MASRSRTRHELGHELAPGAVIRSRTRHELGHELAPGAVIKPFVVEG